MGCEDGRFWHDMLKEFQRQMEDPQLVTTIIFKHKESLDVVKTDMISWSGHMLIITNTVGECWAINCDDISSIDMVLR